MPSRPAGWCGLTPYLETSTSWICQKRARNVVTFLEVLEHVERPAVALAETFRVARRFVVLSVPSKEDDNPEHIHLFSRAALEDLLVGAGATRVTFDGVLNHLIAVARV